MTAAVSTRERLVTEAMRLFSAKGFEATSVSQIEAAAGLAAGSGALYRHFKSKDALLNAGIDRQLDRRHAMRDIRALFAGLGDLHAELTVLGRYLLSVIDEEIQLLQIAARTPAGHSAHSTPPTPHSSTDSTPNWPTGSVPGRPTSHNTMAKCWPHSELTASSARASPLASSPNASPASLMTSTSASGPRSSPPGFSRSRRANK